MKSNISASLSVEQLKRALDVREQIEKLEQELSSILNDTPVTTVAPVKSIAAAKATPAAKGRKGKRIMTDEWKAKIAAAQARRWAKVRAEKAAKLSAVKPLFQSFVKKAASGKKVMSAETKAKIAAAMKASHAAKARANKKF
jgi:hypothetical protein